ncbi:svop [Symbiodinium natans]|uniref:Svop protein n=1 Tax=Symbiodinium natans TaxID=878477 RepID=A0A812LTI1_9DINO|nr:svop [Symbiodinium natans]
MNAFPRGDVEEKSLAEVFDLIGFGRFQLRLLVIAAFGFMADSIEVGVVTFLEQKIPEEWPEAEGWALNALSMSVFGTKLLGSCIWGGLSDHLGRRRAFLLANVFLLVTGCLSALAPSYTWLVVFRGLVGLAIGGIVIPFDNLAELGTLYTNALAASVMETCGWRIYLLLSALPILLACCGYIYLEESPMWLLDRGCDEDALATLQRIAAVNKQELGNIALVSYTREADLSCKELLAPSLRRQLVSLSAIWSLGLFGYYGASMASGFLFASGGAMDYTEVLFTSSGEIVGTTVVLLASWRLSAATLQPWCYLVSGLGCAGVLVAKLASTPPALIAILAFVVRAGSMGGVAVTWVLTPAAFPTHVRSTAHSVLYAWGSAGSLLATLWPAGTSITVIMGSYAIANLVCVAMGVWQQRGMAPRGAFDSLISDLHASNLDRRARSSLARSSRAASRTSTATGRPSTFSRPSWPLLPSRQTS